MKPVIKLTPITQDDDDFLEHFVTAQKGARKVRLSATTPAIKLKYSDYEKDITPIFPGVISLSVKDDCKKDLEELYKSNCKENREQKDAIRKLTTTPNICPYCGRPSPSLELDHILPKSIYPEYAVFSKNLIAVCPNCNKAKSNNYLNKSGSRKFINPYFDNFLSQPIWQLAFEHDLSIPVFKIRNHDNLNGNIQSLCQSHIKELNIIKYFKRYCQSELSQCSTRLEKWGSWEKFKVYYLDPEYQISCEYTGHNSWRSVFLAALKTNQDILREA